MTHLLRYALGLTPADSALGSLPTAVTDGSMLHIEFRRLKRALDIQYIVESSSSLTAWTPLPETPVVLMDNNDGTETVYVETPAGANRMLVRLRVETVP